MDRILLAASAYAQAKVNEALALKSGPSEKYDAAVKRSDTLYNSLIATIAAPDIATSFR
jgi:hypothetical protein